MNAPIRIYLLAAVTAWVVCADDWPDFRGPSRDGSSAEHLTGTLPPDGPELVWERAVGAGFSNPVVSNGRLILFHRQGGSEVVEALEAESGNPIWKYESPTSYRDDFGFDEGPRASPVIAGGQVYVFGAQGILSCLRFSTGKKIWSLDTHREFGVRKGFFGAAATPLVEGSRLFLNVGGGDGAGVVALDRDSGRLLWKATEHEAGYASAVAATIGGKRQILFFTREGFLAVEPADGAILFEKRWRSRSQATVNAATPIVAGERVFLSASYGTGAIALEAQADGFRELWSGEDSLANHYSSAVHHNGVLYGYHGRQEYGASLRAVRLVTGDVLWSEESFGSGTITLAGDLLLLMRENGELVTAPASSERFEPLSRAQILPGTVRAYPALADGLFYVRNQRTLVCVRLK